MEKKVDNIDKQNLRQIIIDSPKQIKDGLKLAEGININGNFNSLMISGMGGSSLPANILRIYLNDLYVRNPEKNKRFGIFQNRSYSLPPEAYENCLNFFSSYSGNTEETILSFKEAVKNNLPSVGFASGGKILEMCQENSIPCVVIPSGIQPRYAIGYSFAAMFQVLSNMGMVENKAEELIGLSRKLEKTMLALEEKGRELAGKLVGKIPVIYSSAKFKSLAMIWKIKINENAKIPSFYNFYPELNHNEMIGYTLPQGKFHVITLLDKNDHPQNIKRMEITAEMLKEKGIGTTIIEIENDNIFNTIFSTLLLGDWVSYYLALAYNQDPTPVEMVEDLKKRLEQSA
ncbi:MAG: bifunctional phosphoglucose/phosphomannose isomerase [Candidatus Moranbacteria bacterium RIFCSPHIGHO2_02_FULL_40_12b]|nr:MAG: bifunctional phosphoglucose/phosphomannose isomerase [Candidatus Moranbacteria bacterium RIFCSPHIGHO2_02_FULL_40_12b]OGI23390.1 MAG: bifunctional phosphoglucose/phosphomannose isomerase [Candidatus Moranbacteria bacterium RIFCSPHIGHO2_12_FULL_40_10]